MTETAMQVDRPMQPDVDTTRRCGARIRSVRPDGKLTCQNYPVTGRARCRMHGGTARRGIDSPSTGSLSRYRGVDLPTQLAARFIAALDDPQLLSLQQDIALVGGRIGQLIARFPTNESAEAWGIVRGLNGQLTTAIDVLESGVNTTVPGDAPGRDALVATIARLREVAAGYDTATDSAHAERAIWREVFDAQEQLRRLNEADRKREEALNAVVTARQGQALFGALLATIVEEVRDPDVKRRILDRLRGLLGRPAPVAVPSTGRELVQVTTP